MKENQSTTQYFVILAFYNHSEDQSVLFFVFLILYLMALVGNMLIAFLVCFDRRLQAPMFFFLLNLSIIDISSLSVTIPKLLAILYSQNYSMSLAECALQLYCFASFVSTEFYILTAMSYDRFVAICYPLRYMVIMGRRTCALLAAVCWTFGFIDTLPEPMFVFRSSFCRSRTIDHFFCDLTALVKLSCTSTSFIETATFVQAMIFGFIPFFLTLTSYAFIISTIVRIRSAEGRLKAFSTCSSHLTVVVLFYGTALFMYMRPRSGFSTFEHKLLAVLYVTIMPLLNPLIYSLRNKDLQEALQKLSGKLRVY